MPCKLETFKRSDPFVWPLWLHNADPTLDLPPDDIARGITIDGDVSFECQINDQFGNFIATMTYEAYADQVADKGWFVILSTDPTDDWPLGIAITDVKVIIDGVQKHSINFEFEVQAVQTP